MVGASCWIDNVDGFIAALKTVFNKRKCYSVFVLTAVEERANMAGYAEFATGKENG